MIKKTDKINTNLVLDVGVRKNKMQAREHIIISLCQCYTVCQINMGLCTHIQLSLEIQGSFILVKNMMLTA